MTKTKDGVEEGRQVLRSTQTLDRSISDPPDPF